jgi:microcystin-dependent protein
MPVYKWSKTSNENAGADPTINMSEGMAPSGLNDGVRAAMSALAKYRDDISGAIVTSGTSTAYAVTSNSTFDSLTNLDGQLIAFTPHATNGATVTLNVDSLGAKPLRTAPGAELLAGVIIEGTPYVAVYNNTDGAFYLQNLYGNPYNIPLGAGIDYWLPTAPNSSFVFPVGQAISRTTYATLFAAMGTTYGAGDGSTTFNLPDKRGRVSASLDNMGGSAASRLSSYTSLGTAGGEQTHTLTLAEIPTSITSAQNQGFNVSVASTTSNVDIGTNPSSTGGGGIGLSQVAGTGQITSEGTVAAGNVTTTSNNTGGGAHANVQPTIACNYIMRVI